MRDYELVIETTDSQSRVGEDRGFDRTRVQCVAAPHRFKVIVTNVSVVGLVKISR